MDLHVGLLERLATASREQGHYRLAARLYRETLCSKAHITRKNECEALVGLSATLAAMDSSEAGLALLRRNADRMLSLDDPLLRLLYRTELGSRMLEANLAAEALELLTAAEVREGELHLKADRMETLQVAGRAARGLGWPDSALVLLREAAKLWEADRGLPLDPEWREQRGASGHELFAQLIGLTLEHPPDRPAPQRSREAFDLLQAYKARTLLERMFGPAGEETPVRSIDPVTLAELQEDILAPGELLLDFLLGEEKSILFACTQDECRVRFVPRQDVLGAKLRLFHELLANPPASDSLPASDQEVISAASREVNELLFSSFADLISRSRHLILVPDGVVNLLPTSCLFVDAEEQGSRRAPMRTPEIFSRIPSATVLARLRLGLDTVATRPGRILALGGHSTQEGQNLPGTMEEVRWLAHHFANTTMKLPLGDSTRTGTESPEKLFAGFDILHFAAHSDANNQYPWRSSIHLSRDEWAEQPTASDESPVMVLYASEIARWKLSSRLVVLTSCQSAGGRILSGEGVQGLTSAFLSAGAQSVLATLWPVDDLATTEFTKSFYRSLQDGNSVSASLREAQLLLAQDPQTADPFYWAGFVLVGDGDLRPELSSRRNLAWLWMLAVGLLLVGTAFWIRRCGRR
jgi:CHAT domain-containing protein